MMILHWQQISLVYVPKMNNVIAVLERVQSHEPIIHVMKVGHTNQVMVPSVSQPGKTCFSPVILVFFNLHLHMSTSRCMYNDFFFVRLMCGVNQTHRFIVCCSEHDYCNDLDAYSSEIRHALTSSPANGKIIYRIRFDSYGAISVKRQHPSGSLVLILIIIISAIFALALLIGGIYIYIKQKDAKKNAGKRVDYDGHKKKNMLERLMKCSYWRKGSGSNVGTDIPSDQSLTGLLDELSTSTMGPGREMQFRVRQSELLAFSF